MQHVWGEERCIQSLGWKPEGKIPVGISGHSFEDNIKAETEGNPLGGRGLDCSGSGVGNKWTGLFWLRGREQVVCCCENGSEPPVSIN